jgi:tRNA(Phe) wybutosine-synthesizing methylase Tyw3
MYSCDKSLGGDVMKGESRISFFSKVYRKVFPRKRDYKEIESAIKPLVDSINAVPSLCTIASCQGHWDGRPPYVYFLAPVSIAAQIEKQLREDAMSNHRQLNANWSVRGLFNENYEQVFLLHAPGYHQGAESLVRAVWLFGIGRRRLDAELVRLTYLVEQAICANIWQEDKPEIDGDAH